MIFEGALICGRFVKRLNRFEAIVEVDGDESLTHVPNTGRLRELLQEGAEVLIRVFDNPKRKTKYGLLLVKKEEIWVSIDSAGVPNRIVYDALKNKKLAQFTGFNDIKREVTYGNSRFDFGLKSRSGEEYYIEVKGVTLVEDRKAYFPDAPTQRGRRHIEELTRIKQQGKGAGVIFIIQRSDADVIMPNMRTDPEFSMALKKACNEGVDMWAYRCMVSEKQLDLDCEIPVVIENNTNDNM